MMGEHAQCPECDSHQTTVEFSEEYSDHIEQVRVCKDCPTQWTIEWASPIVREVETYE